MLYMQKGRNVRISTMTEGIIIHSFERGCEYSILFLTLCMLRPISFLFENPHGNKSQITYLIFYLITHMLHIIHAYQDLVGILSAHG